MPWANTEFKLDLIKPVQNYFNHLMADPSTNPIQLPDLVQFGRTIQALIASMVVAFDPFTPGSPFCAGNCKMITDLHMDYPDIVRSIGALWPGNKTIDGWLTAYDTGKANVPTQEQIDNAVAILQPGPWSFGNPSPPPGWFSGFNPSTLAPQFHALWTALGFNPPPLNNTPIAPEQTSGVNALVGGPETQVKADAIEKDPPSTIASAQISGDGAPPGGSAATNLRAAAATPPAAAATPPTDAATPPAQGGGRTPPTGLNQGLPPLTGSEPQTPSAAPSTDTVRTPGLVPRLADQLLPHPSDTNTATGTNTTTGTSATGSGGGAEASGGSAATGAHSDGGSAG
jgi:hypothetical protein